MIAAANDTADDTPTNTAANSTDETHDGPRADYGVIGGSGFYEFFDDAETVAVHTPYGPPSDNLVIGTLGERRVAFIARHGQGHRFPPHQVNYRANLWALRSVGVRQIVAPCAVGSLKQDNGPGTIVVPDQVVDRTWGRAHTFYDVEGPVVHVEFADPYCPLGRAAAVERATEAGADVVDGGALVVINGPRFSTRAESQMHQGLGFSIVGMTAMPEAALARELAMCFTTVALVTDHDAGVEGGAAVTHEQVLAAFAENVDRLKSVIAEVVTSLPAPDEPTSCRCQQALDGLRLPIELP
ncbi:MAG: S-methyl-5'-thioadenosine phosphorylase [Actinomycetia bacterium]|nr:S-methyl-5'-thioadenosine phosphorylase [Actinomycetes bacterium]